MKTACFITVILASYTAGYSQSRSTAEWGEINSEWYYTHLYFATLEKTYNKIVSTGDTVINGINCKVLEKEKWSCTQRSLTEFMYSQNQKVYFYEDSVNDFWLLYDFSKNAGEIWKIPTWFEIYDSIYQPIDSIIVYVDSTELVDLNGVSLKKMYVRYLNYYPSPYWTYHDTIIESIGSLTQMFPFDENPCDNEYDNGLRCFSSPTIGEFKLTTHPCDTTINPYSGYSLNEQDYLPFTILVDPLNQEILIESVKQPLKSVRIVSSSGNEMLYVQNIESEVKLSIQNLATGLYMVVLETEGKLYSKKFLKMQ